MHRRSRAPRLRPLVPLLTVSLLAAAIAIAPSALAAPNAVVGTLNPDSVPAGASRTVAFTMTTTSGTARSFNLTAPNGWSLSGLAAPAGVTLASPTQIQGRNLSVDSSSSLTISFTSKAPCAATSTGWSLVARSGGGFNGSTFGVDGSSVLSSPLTGTCSSAFVPTRGPADAGFNGNPKSENITSQPYTPAGPAIQAQATDGAGDALAGAQLTLGFGVNPPTANLTGPTSATTDANGIATFTGSAATPISISKVSQGYTLKATGAGIVATASDPFGIYQEGKVCGSGLCSVHGSSADNKISADVSGSGGGTNGVLVQQFDLSCNTPTTPGTQLSSSAIIWKYTGSGAQTVTAFVDRSLVKTVTDRGGHIDVCFQVDPGKPTFTDKFGTPGVTTGYLPDCRPAAATNCIVSETGLNGGKIIVFTVEDGKGRI
jgi:hypothetical protein